MIGRQDLSEQVFEKKLAETAAKFRRPKNFLERSDIFADFIDFPVGFFQPAQTSLHVADHARSIVQSFPKTLLRLIQDLCVFSQTFVHMPDHLSQLLLDRLSAVVQGAAQLCAQFADLLLHQQHRLLVSALLQEIFEPAKEKPAEKSQTTNNEEKNQQKSGQFHNETVAQSEEPYSVFQDFTELTNLRRAHGAFFARCGEIIIDALFEIPLQQLHALLHAHFF